MKFISPMRGSCLIPSSSIGSILGRNPFGNLGALHPRGLSGPGGPLSKEEELGQIREAWGEEPEAYNR